MDKPELSVFVAIDDFLTEIGVGRREMDDPFFEQTHKISKVFQRTGVTVEDDEDLCHDVMREFPCNVFGCKAMFRNLIDFEIHYNGSHRYVCQECKKVRPNARLLEIHIQETHDSYFRVLAQRQQPVYQCYVSECDTKFNNPSERHEHSTTVHKFPKHFRYNCEGRKKEKPEGAAAMDVEPRRQARSKPKEMKIILNKNQRSKTFVPNASHPSTAVSNFNKVSQMECSANKSEIIPNVEDKEIGTEKSKPIAKSTLAFVPRQVANKSYTNALTNNKKMSRNVLESETLMDLAESLPE